MGLKTDVIAGVSSFFDGAYEITDGRVIPNLDDIALGRSGRELEMAMLFVDIRESTAIVNGFRRVTAARMYKSFLWGVTRIARNNDGELLSFNGDGVLVGFSGELKCTHAAMSALQLAWFCREVMQVKLKSYLEGNRDLNGLDFDMGIGVDVGKVLIVRGGMKGENNNDLVWVGNATNLAVKLSALGSAPFRCRISKRVYDAMTNAAKLSSPDKRKMWEPRKWLQMGGQLIYRSEWTWIVPD